MFDSVRAGHIADHSFDPVLRLCGVAKHAGCVKQQRLDCCASRNCMRHQACINMVISLVFTKLRIPCATIMLHNKCRRATSHSMRGFFPEEAGSEAKPGFAAWGSATRGDSAAGLDQAARARLQLFAPATGLIAVVGRDGAAIHACWARVHGPVHDAPAVGDAWHISAWPGFCGRIRATTTRPGHLLLAASSMPVALAHPGRAPAHGVCAQR